MAVRLSLSLSLAPLRFLSLCLVVFLPLSCQPPPSTPTPPHPISLHDSLISFLSSLPLSLSFSLSVVHARSEGGVGWSRDTCSHLIFSFCMICWVFWAGWNYYSNIDSASGSDAIAIPPPWLQVFTWRKRHGGRRSHGSWSVRLVAETLLPVPEWTKR